MYKQYMTWSRMSRKSCNIILISTSSSAHASSVLLYSNNCTTTTLTSNCFKFLSVQCRFFYLSSYLDRETDRQTQTFLITLLHVITTCFICCYKWVLKGKKKQTLTQPEVEVVEKGVLLLDSVENHISIPAVKVPMKALWYRHQLQVLNSPNLQACRLACGSELFVVEHHVCCCC